MTTYSVATIADRLGIEKITSDIGLQQEYSGLGSGTGWGTDLAPPNRNWEVSLYSRDNAEAARTIALLEQLDGLLNSFYMYDPRKIYPRSDPDGSILAGQTITINSLGSDNHSLSLDGLPAGWDINIGDFLHWDFGSSPTRRAFHRCVQRSVADGSGTTSEFDVRGYILGGTVGTAVTLIKPAMKAQLIPNSLRDQSDGKLNTILSFKVMQLI
jgi:hypothetical protein